MQRSWLWKGLEETFGEKEAQKSKLFTLLLVDKRLGVGKTRLLISRFKKCFAH